MLLGKMFLDPFDSPPMIFLDDDFKILLSTTELICGFIRFYKSRFNLLMQYGESTALCQKPDITLASYCPSHCVFQQPTLPFFA